jgi:hypothetical protein
MRRSPLNSNNDYGNWDKKAANSHVLASTTTARRSELQSLVAQSNASGIIRSLYGEEFRQARGSNRIDEGICEPLESAIRETRTSRRNIETGVRLAREIPPPTNGKNMLAEDRRSHSGPAPVRSAHTSIILAETLRRRGSTTSPFRRWIRLLARTFNDAKQRLIWGQRYAG